MGAAPGDCEDKGDFVLLNHLEENLSTEESIEKILQHFTNISKEFPPLNEHTLPDCVKAQLNAVNDEILPNIEDYQVYKAIQNAKKPKSGVPGDLPRKLVQKFAPELATPVGKIFRGILKTNIWPRSWAVE